VRRRDAISPLAVGYDDLIRSTEKSLTWMKTTYPRRILERSISAWEAQHNIAVEEAKLRLFKKFKKDPQIDLFKAHQHQ